MIKLKPVKPLISRLTQISKKIRKQQISWQKQVKPFLKKAQEFLDIFLKLVKETARLALNFAHWVLVAIVLAFLTLPYQISRAFTPYRRNASQPISKFFRKVFETKKVKRALGANLAVMILVGSVFQNSLPTLATENNLAEVLPEPTEIITTETTLRNPVGGYLSQSFNWYHPGIDIAGNDNQIMYPITKGVVVAVESGILGYGNSVVIKHENKLMSRYAHLSKIKVEQGQEVDKNTALGYVGSTGWSTGPHLHLEIYEDGQAVNPLSVLPEEF